MNGKQLASRLQRLSNQMSKIKPKYDCTGAKEQLLEKLASLREAGAMEEESDTPATPEQLAALKMSLLERAASVWKGIV